VSGDGEQRKRAQSLGEEIANSVSHGVGLLAALIAAPVLVVDAIRRGDTAGIAGACVFAATMVLLYITSTLYHALPPSRAKAILRILDHSAIYLFIAGTYTPFALGVLRGPWGSSLVILVWGLALVGIGLKATGGVGHPRLSAGIYLAMGWLVLVAAKPLVVAMPPWGLFWLLAGGLVYTAGVGFFAAPRVRYTHFVWHLFVAAGTTCHFVAVLRYAS
jgi:hemolysin III